LRYGFDCWLDQVVLLTQTFRSIGSELQAKPITQTLSSNDFALVL
jgi:hypothetical protein